MAVQKSNTNPSPKTFQNRLLQWFDRHRRAMPWRAAKGQAADPYHVWLSEVMLQQTTVAAVEPYFKKFIRRWPTVEALAAADLDEVLQVWAGLGYYARARNLHACAKAIADEKKGHFPHTVEEWLELPGIGPYSAAAIAAIAFNQPAVAVDGNVERVVARFFNIRRPLPAAKAELRRKAESLGEGIARAGDFVQAFMELGSTVCVPAKPRCAECPVQALCKIGDPAKAAPLPRKAPKKQKPSRSGIVYWIEDGKGRVFVRRRPEKGLLGGMIEFPSTGWEAAGDLPAPRLRNRRNTGLRVEHSFSHFDLSLEIHEGTAATLVGGQWVEIHKIGKLALPSLMSKVVRIRLAQKTNIVYNKRRAQKRRLAGA